MDVLPLATVSSWEFTWVTLLTWLAFLVDLTIKIVAVGVIPNGRRPATAMAWLILILLIPFGGFLIFLFLGRIDVGRKRLARQREIDASIREVTDTLDVPVPDRPAYLPGLATLGRQLGAIPMLPGNRVTLEPDYAAAIAGMTDLVEQASSTIEAQFYISAWDDMTAPFFEALVAATERGVTVRYLYDHLGSRGIPGFKQFEARLQGTKIQSRAMLPVRPLKGQFQRPDLRNHRKMLVVDGRAAYMGSQNLTEPGYNKPKNHAAGREWVELVARVDGRAVTALRAVFAKDWFAETGERIAREVAADHTDDWIAGPVACQIVPSGPGYASENNLRVFSTLIYAAQRRVSLTSPYFVPDEPLLYAVTSAAQRGLDVELFVSEAGDQFMVHHAQRSYYQALLESGVRIWLYPAPAVLHSKHFSIDDDVAVIGSSNMDMRSFALNYEVSAVLAGGGIVGEFRRVEDAYRSVSRELTLEEWVSRPSRAKYVDNAMRLTAGLQ